jgi:hypothetical protein
MIKTRKDRIPLQVLVVQGGAQSGGAKLFFVEKRVDGVNMIEVCCQALLVDF